MADNYAREGWGDSVFVRNDRLLPPFVDGNAGNNVFGEKYLETLVETESYLPTGWSK